MRLHTNVLTRVQIIDALNAERHADRIAQPVWFRILDQHRSTTHTRAFEVQLEATSKAPGDGRRTGSMGAYGVTQPCTLDSRCGRTRGHFGVCDWGGETFAATYDEWGWMLSALYRLDPDMVAGSVKRPIYADGLDFHDKTGQWYALGLADSIDAGDPDDDPYPWVRARNGRPEVGKVGRRGSIQRLTDRQRDDLPRYALSMYVHAPRTAAKVRAFAHLPQPVGVTA